MLDSLLSLMLGIFEIVCDKSVLISWLGSVVGVLCGIVRRVIRVLDLVFLFFVSVFLRLLLIFLVDFSVCISLSDV